MYIKALIVWSAIIPLAVANGLFRDVLLARWMGREAARSVSGLLLCGAILCVAVVAVPWLGPARAGDYVAVGLTWLVLTLAFEFGFGRLVAGKSWVELLAPYTFKGGDLWPLVLLVVAAAPYFAARLQNLV